MQFLIEQGIKIYSTQVIENNTINKIWSFKVRISQLFQSPTFQKNKIHTSQYRKHFQRTDLWSLWKLKYSDSIVITIILLDDDFPYYFENTNYICKQINIISLSKGAYVEITRKNDKYLLTIKKMTNLVMNSKQFVQKFPQILIQLGTNIFYLWQKIFNQQQIYFDLEPKTNIVDKPVNSVEKNQLYLQNQSQTKNQSEVLITQSDGI